MERLLGRALSQNEKAAAVSLVVGLIAAFVTRELLQDYIEDNQERFLRTKTSRRHQSTNELKQQLMSTESDMEDQIDSDGVVEDKN